MASSSRSSMELIFMLTSRNFAQEGSKATQFDVVCRALGVQFDFSKSEAGLMAVCNTEARRQELIQQITAALKRGTLEKQETLSLSSRLGFADSFLHGRVGKLVLKHLVDHAYGPTRRFEPNLMASLSAIVERLTNAKPRTVTSLQLRQWFIYTDANFETDALTDGLGGVLIDEHASG